MRSPRSLYFTNRDEFGQRMIVEENDPRAAVKATQAGDWMPDELAMRLGLTQYLTSSEGESRRGMSMAQARSIEGDPEALANKGGQLSDKVRQEMYEHPVLRTPSIEERSYVENAVGEPYNLSAHERAQAGAMGAEHTGPTLPERAEAGGDVKAAEDKASQAMGGEPAKAPGEHPPQSAKPEEPSPSGRPGRHLTPGSSE